MTVAQCSGALDPPVDLSLVIPVFNEEGAIVSLLREALQSLTLQCLAYEVLVVDDGSHDRTVACIEEANDHLSGVRILRLQRNSGQAAALLVGLRAARGEIVITMDGDGQNDPADIPRLLEALDSADMVVGVRAARRDSRLRRLMSRLANGVRSRLLGDGVRDGGCALKAFRREIVAELLPIRTLYSFIPAFAVAAGYRVCEVEVNHRPRRSGVSSYGLRQFAFWPLIDLFGVWWFTRRRVQLPQLQKAGEESAAQPQPQPQPQRSAAHTEGTNTDSSDSSDTSRGLH